MPAGLADRTRGLRVFRYTNPAAACRDSAAAYCHADHAAYTATYRDGTAYGYPCANCHRCGHTAARHLKAAAYGDADTAKN